MTSNIIFAAQTALLSKLPQGDDSVTNAIMSAVIIAAIGLATSYGQSMFCFLYTKIKRWFGGSHIFKDNKHTVYVPQYSEDAYGDRTVNVFFNSFGWYITRKSPCSKGALVAVQNTVHEKYVVPEPNHEASLRYEDVTIRYVYEKREKAIGDNKTTIECGIRFSVVSDDAKVIIDMLNHVHKSRQEAQNNRVWTQSLYYPLRRSDGLRWSGGRDTYNMKTWDTVVLERSVKDRLVNDLDVFMKSEKWYKTMGVSWARGLLLYGKPGCGKTSIVKALSHVHKMDLYYLALNEVQDDNELRILFESIPPRSVLVLEDVDAMGKDIVKKRTEEPEVKVEEPEDKSSASEKLLKLLKTSSEVTLSSFLNLLDGVASVHGRITVMTTNHPEKLDPALLRPGRCDLKIHVRTCDEDSLRELYKIYFDTEIPQADLDLIKGYRLTPADVTSVFLTNRLSPDLAITILAEIGRANSDKEDDLVDNGKNDSFLMCR